MRRLVHVVCVPLAAIGLATGAASAAAEPALGIVKGTKILAGFDTAHPGTFTGAMLITGVGPGERLEDVDFRYHPNGELNPLPPPQLFALGVRPALAYEAHLYTIDLGTGVATPLGALFQVPGGNTYGIDFNPTADRIRGVNDFDGNFRINPNNGSPTSDISLNPPGDKVSGLAYSGVDTPIPPSVPANSTAYGIGVTASALYTIGGLGQAPSPNGGALLNPKPLGLTLTLNSPVGFDIDRAGNAFATLVELGDPGVYTINLSTGAATLVGKLPETLSGFAIVPEQAPVAPPDTTPPTVALKGVKGSLSLKAFLKGIKVKATPSEPAKLKGELVAAARSAQLASFNLTLATKSVGLGAGERTLKLKPRKALVGHRRKAFKVQLRVTATDAAGNAKTVTKTIKVKPRAAG